MASKAGEAPEPVTIFLHSVIDTHRANDGSLALLFMPTFSANILALKLVVAAGRPRPVHSVFRAWLR